MRKKKCTGCERMVVMPVGGPTTFEHPSVLFRVCSDCTNLLVSAPPGYPWRMKLLTKLERALGLKRADRAV